MDETTISDIKQRVARWERDSKRDGKESERTWIFAVNIDDVELLLKEIDRTQKENDDLRLQLQAARDQLQSYSGQLTYPALTLDQAEAEFRRQPILNVYDGSRIVARVRLDGEALEPDAPDGEMKYWFNIATGPYRALDIQAERDFSWSRGPFGSYREADREWKAYIKRQNANGQP